MKRIARTCGARAVPSGGQDEHRKALYWSAVINGVVAVPVMVVMMLMTARPEVMGKFTIKGGLRWLGWAATLAMTACVVGMFVGWFVGD